MADLNWRDSFLRLSASAALKHLEEPYLYHISRDELYEIDGAAESFLSSCDGTRRGMELTDDREFVSYCLSEGILDALSRPCPTRITIGRGATPSLRYLELQLTHSCNLRCRHCYLGPPRPVEFPLADALAITWEFAAAGGLKLLVSGGEPLLYPWLREFIEATAGLGLRRVLLTNATLITPENAGWLAMEEVQARLDAWEEGHDLLRGRGSFERAVAGIRAASDAGIPVGIATMVHRGNLTEFEKLARFADEIDAVEWGIDSLCDAGTVAGNRDLLVPAWEAAPFMAYGFGGGYHGSGEGFACGRHLMTVLPSGNAVKCGFYEDQPLGNAREGLLACWQRLSHIALSDLDCRACQAIEECAGGCRFRAERPLGPDKVMCALYGVEPPQEQKG